MFRILFVAIFLLYTVRLSAGIEKKYPTYTYVLSEFDVDGRYAWNSDFLEYVKKHEKGMHVFYGQSLKRGEAILPMISEKLMDEGLSDLFLYLAMVESGFSPVIVSPKKAVGLWQFMPKTAKHYNLDIDYSFDERCDPVCSTNAAIAYLKKLHKQFGKWYLAALAYNCGEGRLEKAIKKAGSDDLAILIDNENKYLPAETRRYMQKILLLAMIGEGKTLDFFVHRETLVQVEVKGGTNLEILAKGMEMNMTKLLDLNRQFKGKLVPKAKADYNITIPYEKMIAFYLLKDEKKEAKKTPYFISHTVRMGETLESIAKTYQASVEEIQTMNGLKERYLTLNKLLIIPVTKRLFYTIKGKKYDE